MRMEFETKGIDKCFYYNTEFADYVHWFNS
ncbi:hypothetical protein DJ95_1616 [Bacillus atrophaeus subsp. globigii]|nr:hypothetical protein DJ95_1616 [Bacillus atrophaeus subsp. globigii]KFK84671.1 hypothetical protein DK44_2017 [Bacillus atrophaeus]MDQ0928089.1 hypothetical protein [Bacillus atrophaeus]